MKTLLIEEKGLTKGATMSLFTRSVSILWVLMFFVSSANNNIAMALTVVAKNSLDGNLDLTISCPSINPQVFLLRPCTNHEWVYSGQNISLAKPPFLCYFQWQNASHSFNMYHPILNYDCNELHWQQSLHMRAASLDSYLYVSRVQQSIFPSCCQM